MVPANYAAAMSQTASVMYVPLRPEYRGQDVVQHLDAPMFLPYGGVGYDTQMPQLPQRDPSEFLHFF